MAEIYLLPENIGAADASMVLDFLNAAQSAEEIATAVEISNELDIGLRVGSRILARREQLGGFTSLEQVYAVPYVGPERFTELVTSLSGARPPQMLDEQVDRALLAQITRRLNTLEAALGSNPTIRMRAINPDALLGQETLLLAELKDGDGKPLIDRELMLITTWGLLSGRAGLQSVAGNSVTVRSDHLGLCRIRLSAAFGEALTAVEISSLTQALTLLGQPNDNPRDSLPALTELARRYRAPGNDALRRVIDVFFKRYGGIEQVEVPVDSLAAWPRIAVTLIAWLTPDPDSATTQIPTALLQVHQRNWFYTWLWAYRQMLQNESGLGASLLDVSGDKRSGGGVLTDLFGRVGSFVKAQDGLVGQQLGQAFAAASLNGFLQSGLDKFSPEERTQLVTGVTSGVKSLSSTQPFTAFEGNRAELNLEIDARISGVDSSTQFDDLEARLTQVENSALTQDDVAAIQADVAAEINRANSANIDQLRGEFNDALGSKADTTSIEQLRKDFDSALDGKADSTRVDQLDNQVATLGEQSRTFDASLNQMDTRLSGVDRRVDGLSVRVPRRP